MKQEKYAFKKIENNKDKNEFLEFLKHQTTAEYGGYQIFDGRRTHLLHIPEELSELIFLLKQHERSSGKKIKKFLEIGFSSGKTNTVFNKFFQFEQIVAVDNFSAHISTNDLWANLMRKKLILLTGKSNEKSIINHVKKFGPFDFIFIDGSHDYKDIKNDLEVFSKFLSNKGIIAVHDIKNKEYPGVKKAWNEFKSGKKFKFKEIFCDDYLFYCGVGIITK